VCDWEESGGTQPPDLKGKTKNTQTHLKTTKKKKKRKKHQKQKKKTNDYAVHKSGKKNFSNNLSRAYLVPSKTPGGKSPLLPQRPRPISQKNDWDSETGTQKECMHKDYYDGRPANLTPQLQLLVSRGSPGNLGYRSHRPEYQTQDLYVGRHSQGRESSRIVRS